MLRAFLAGATEATMEGRTRAEAVATGVKEVSVICDAWRRSEAKFEPPSLSDLEAAMLKENKVGAPSGKEPALQR